MIFSANEYWDKLSQYPTDLKKYRVNYFELTIKIIILYNCT